MKTRFAILYAGEEKQLFSVQEGSDKSLYIFQNVFQTSFGGDGLVPVKNQKISVHSKREHEGKLCNKVKFNFVSTNGDNYDQSIIVHDKQNSGFLYPIVNSMEGTYLSPDLNLKPKPDDDIVKLFGYIGNWETLSFTVYAHDNHVNMPEVQGFTRIKKSYSDLSLTIYFTFFHVSDSRYSLASHHINGGLRKNSQLLQGNPEIVNRMSVNGVEAYLQKQHMILAKSMINMKEIEAREAGKPFTHPGFPFHRWPERSDDQHEDYGEYSRRKSEIYQAPRYVNGTLKSPQALRDEQEKMRQNLRYIWRNI